MLEGLQETKCVQPHVALGGWKGLPKKIELRNYLLYRYGNGRRTYQPKRMKDRVDEAFTEIQTRAAWLIESQNAARVAHAPSAGSHADAEILPYRKMIHLFRPVRAMGLKAPGPPVRHRTAIAGRA